MNGTYILNADCLEKNICADYSNVIFSLRTNKNYEKDIFIIGEFNNNVLSEKYKMKKEFKNYYTKDIVLKQGLYNYKYVIKTKNGFKDIFHNYIITVPEEIRNDLMSSLYEYGIETKIHYNLQ